MRLAHNDNGSWEYWNGEPRHQTGMGDELFQLPRNAGDSYSHQKLATFGLRIIGRDDVPEGKQVVETVLGDRAGRPWEFLTLEDIPEPEPVPVTFRIAKDAIWRRATDAEVLAMDAELIAQGPRIVRIYEGATHIETSDALYALLEWTLTELFGEARALELLEPTE